MKFRFNVQASVEVEVEVEPGEDLEAIEADFQQALYNSIFLGSNIDDGVLKVEEVEVA